MKYFTILGAAVLLAVVVICIPSQVNGQRSRHFPAPFYGACSARLMDTLHTICGSHGISLVKNILIMRRYRKSRRFRRNGAMLRRGRRSIDDTQEINPGLSFSEARSRFAGFPLSSIVEVAQEINTERKHKKRVRRQIAQECCENSCDMSVIRQRYCHFRYR